MSSCVALAYHERAPLSLYLASKYHHRIAKFKLRFLQIITYQAEYPEFKVKREKFIVADKESGGVPPCEKRWLQYKIKIPACPPTNHGYCKAIGIAYVLYVIVHTPKMYRNEKLRLPITIGTVPLAAENIFSVQSLQTQALAAQEIEPINRRVLARADSLPPTYADILPIEETPNLNGESNFKKIYRNGLKPSEKPTKSPFY